MGTVPKRVISRPIRGGIEERNLGPAVGRTRVNPLFEGLIHPMVKSGWTKQQKTPLVLWDQRGFISSLSCQLGFTTGTGAYVGCTPSE